MSATANSASTPLRARVLDRDLDGRALSLEPGHGRPPQLRGRDGQRADAAAEVGRAAARLDVEQQAEAHLRGRVRPGAEPAPAALDDHLEHPLRRAAGPTASARRAGRRSAPRRRRSGRAARASRREPARARGPPAAPGSRRSARRRRAAPRRPTRSRPCRRRSAAPRSRTGSSGRIPSSTSSRVSAGMRNAMRCIGERYPVGAAGVARGRTRERRLGGVVREPAAPRVDPDQRRSRAETELARRGPTSSGKPPRKGGTRRRPNLPPPTCPAFQDAPHHSAPTSACHGEP